MLVALIMAATLAPQAGQALPLPTSPGSVAAPLPGDMARSPGDRDQIVCRKEQVVGSLLPNRVCMTRAQWADYMQQSRKGLESQQNASERSRLPGN